jgi:hypothetical protein
MAWVKHKWIFPSRFRAGAYSWKASKLACQRLREAVSEIKKVAKKAPVLGAEGAVRLMEKLWSALEHVDSSSGALGSAVNKALDVLIPIIIKAPGRSCGSLCMDGCVRTVHRFAYPARRHTIPQFQQQWTIYFLLSGSLRSGTRLSRGSLSRDTTHSPPPGITQ